MASSGVSDDARRKANLRVLQRGDSAIADIVGNATHVGLYEFDQQANGWEKKHVEGSLFLVRRYEMPRYRLIILNRNSQDNFEVNLTANLQLQKQDPYLIFRQKMLDGTSVIQGIWFHNGQERDKMAALLSDAVQELSEEAKPQTPPLPRASPAQARTPSLDAGAAAAALMSPLTLGNHTIPVSKAGPNTFSSPPPSARTSASSESPATPQATQQPNLLLDKKSLQLSLLSLIQDERFLDIIHAQYLKVAQARANRNKNNGSNGENH
eukprot:CAMPEP_0194064432 /NCGR_PEP_ID=MMETSP0009_2-20130614/83034_1 /TAXON_ID=210454 /ORGANISM="Grammatophora oceanica, Strain CCMP 410" /LENGTH=266 /DNA_ID=CAMNT_0038716905 /DNA_START=75 /DNA_END=878 /DNA_ORIENTATION=+